MACSKFAPKRKLDSKNRQFQPEWTERFAFFLPPSSTRPLCLICQESVAAIKLSNVKRHYDSKHKHFEETFPQNSENITLRETQCDVITLWTKMVTAANFPLLNRMAVHILTMFGSTYRCESAFSKMNFIKNQYRSRLTNEHVHQCVSLAITPYQPRFEALAKESRGQFSH